MTATAQAPAAAPNARLVEQLEKIVTNRIENDQLILPSLPAVAAKCLALTKKPEFSLREAAAIIEKDPILTAQLLRLVNSAALGTREPIKSVLQTVTRLGVQKLRTFLLEASARKVFESKDHRIADACRGLWDHSLAVGLLARDVVTYSNGGDPDIGYLGGLLHDIGKPVVAAMLLEAEKAVLGAKATATWIDGAQWVGVILRCHRAVGVKLAKKWELPEAVASCIAECAEYNNSDRLSVGNAVRFANALSKQLGIYVGEVDKEDVEALVMIGKSLLNLDDQSVSKLTASIKQALREAHG